MRRIPCAIVLGILASSALWSGGVPPSRLLLLSRGINIDNWFSSYSDPKRFASRLGESDFSLIKGIGISVIRLTLAPETLFNEAQPAAMRDTVRYVSHCRTRHRRHRAPMVRPGAQRGNPGADRPGAGVTNA